MPSASPDPDYILFHNPACSTSRNVLAMVREHGIEPTIVEYLKALPGKERLRELVAALGGSVRGLLRTKAAPYEELGLADPKWTDEQLLDFMVQHPVLMERPVLVSPRGTRLGRPKEAVLDLLPS